MRKTVVAIVAAVILVALTTGFAVPPIDTPDFLDNSIVPGGQLLFSVTQNVNQNATFTTPVLSVAAFGQLFLQLQQTSADNGNITLKWFSDAAGTVQIGPQPSFDKNTASNTQWAQQVIAPYFTLSWRNNGTAQRQILISIFGFGQTIKLNLPQLTGVLIPTDSQGVSVGAGSTVTVNPGILMPGTGVLWINAPATTTVAIQYWTGSVWDYLMQLEGGTVTDANAKVNLPLADWRVRLINNSGSVVSIWAVITMDS